MSHSVVAEQKMIIIGRLGRPYGVSGWQHIQSFMRQKDDIAQLTEWFIESKTEGWVRHEVLHIKPHDKGFVAKLSGIKDKEHASLFSNLNIAIPRSQLSEVLDGEFYWADLEGLSVKTKDGTDLGKVAFLYDNAGTDVLVVRAKEKERHIPFVWQDTVLDVDFEQRLVTLDWDFDIA